MTLVNTFFKQPRAVTEKAPKRMRRTSVKNAASEAELVKNRAKVLERHPICQRCGIRKSSHAHHILPRSAGGGHGEHNLLAVCDGPFNRPGGVDMGCHFEIHAAPAEAYREGWMRRKHPKPGDAHYVEVPGE